MKKLLLLLIPVFAFGQGTDLPGPISALPTSFGPTGVCAWNTGVTFKTCFLPASGTAANYFVTAQAANYILAGVDFANVFTKDQTISVSSGNALTVNANISCTGICSLGDTTHFYADTYTNAVVNPNPGTALVISGESSLAGVGMAIVTTTAADLVFYPNSTEALRIEANKNLLMSGGDLLFSANNVSHIGSATAQAANIFSVDFEAVSGSDFCQYNFTNIYCNVGGVNEYVLSSAGTLLLHSLAGTGYRRVCTDSTGTIVVSGSCPVNSTLFTTCTNTVTLTSTYQTTGCTLTSTVSGYWLLTSTVLLINTFGSANFGAFINGSLPLSTDISTLANTSSGQVDTSLTHSWIYNLNVGDTVDIRANSPVGPSNQSGAGNLTMVYLHP